MLLQRPFFFKVHLKTFLWECYAWDASVPFWLLGEVPGAVTQLAAVSWIKNCTYCKFTLENLIEQPGIHVISNFFLTLFTYIMIDQNLMCGFLLQVWCVKLVNNLYFVKYTVYLNIFLLQIIFIHENSKRYNLSWESYFLGFTKSLLILSTLSDVNFFKGPFKIIWEWSL